MSSVKLQEINIASIFYMILLAGFIVISGFPYFFSVESRVFTVPFRAIVLAFSIFIILRAIFYHKGKVNLNSTIIFYVVFWIVYLINVYLSFRNYQFTEDFKLREYEVYVRIIGVCLIPSLALFFLEKKQINYSLIFNVVYFLIFIILLLNVFVGIKYNDQGRTSGFLSTYSINFGHIGVTLALMSLYKLIFKTERFDYYSFLMFFGFVLGTYIMYASATRGPLIAFVFTIIVALVARKKKNYLILFCVLILLGVIGIIYLGPQNTIEGKNWFLQRLSNMLVSGDSSGRDKLYKDALTIFIENPFFGGRFLFADGVYAHNIFLDILMSMGIFGMMLFVPFFTSCVKEILKLFPKEKIVENDYIWIHLLFCQYLTFAFFSCSMFDTPEFWYLTAMLLTINKNRQQKCI